MDNPLRFTRVRARSIARLSFSKNHSESLYAEALFIAFSSARSMVLLDETD
jgi:hypothetical protein